MFLSQWQMLCAALWAVFVGFFLGAVYDLFRILHLTLESPKRGSSLTEGLRIFIVFIGDILYAAFSAIVVCILLYHTNYGRIRWFMFFGALAGFLIWRFTVGRLIMFVAGALISFVRSVFAFVVRRMIIPLLGFLLVIIKFTKYTLAYIPKRIYNIYYRKNKHRFTQKMTVQMIEEARRGFSF